ncbi:hypothetical protein KUTeg_011388 [Tegillarca granosa]|uniref:Micro-fibrillar-associated protein 1 C-terminal domain-containing protein n=1 Tax=Tegillarca granosa TaxID=220873 RepID=A0ABQ9F0W7_TEGGR|nr:hypothetical protein KUTeg_011388 [Tegillarca granosa]
MSGTSQVPIQSTAGAIPMKNEKGEVTMQKVKVARYVTGKRPDYAPESSSDEEEEFDFSKKKKQQSVKEDLIEDKPDKEEILDRRIRRLQERDLDIDIARHRREVVEPEIIQEGSDSDNEAKRRREDEESSESEEELDEEKEEEHCYVRGRYRDRKKTRKERITIQEKEREEAKQKELEMEAKRLAEERRKQTLKMVEEEARREIEEERGVLEACDAINSGDENDEEEYEAWKLRELKRMKRDKEEREAEEKEKLEIDRVRNLTEEERRQEFKQNPKQIINKAPKGKYKFLQKYYHRGAFFLSDEDVVYKRDFSAPTLEDHFDKTILPKVMQVKNFGRSGRTKYTHLVDQDTTQFDAPWMTDTAQNLKFHTSKGGGMKQSFSRPSNKKRK